VPPLFERPAGHRPAFVLLITTDQSPARESVPLERRATLPVPITQHREAVTLLRSALDAAHLFSQYPQCPVEFDVLVNPLPVFSQ